MAEIDMRGEEEEELDEHLDHVDFEAAFKAITKEDLETLQGYYDCGGKTNTTNKNGWTLLHQAAHKGKSEVLPLLFSHGENPDVEDQDKHTALYYAIIHGHKEVCDILCAEKAEVSKLYAMQAAAKGLLSVVKKFCNYPQEKNPGNTRDTRPNCNGWTLLTHAAANGHPHLLKWLIKNARSNVNAKDVMGQTPLYYAIHNNQEACVSELVKAGAPVPLPDAIKAVRHGLLEPAKALIRGDPAACNARTAAAGDSLLMAAAAAGAVRAVRLCLLAPGVDVQLKNNNGKNALYLACRAGRADCARELVDAGASLEMGMVLQTEDDQVLGVLRGYRGAGGELKIKDIRGQSLLTWAAFNGKLDVCEFMVEAVKYDINDKDNDGHMALDWAFFAKHWAVVEYLFRRGTCGGLEHAMAAAAEGRLAIVQAYLENGANPNATDGQGLTLLMHACKSKNNTETIQWLLRKGRAKMLVKQIQSRKTAVEMGFELDPQNFLLELGLETSDHLGHNALHAACAQNRGDMVRELVKRRHGHNLDSKTYGGLTGLLMAAKAGHIEIIKTLASTGRVDLYIEDFQGMNALHTACRWGHLPVVRYLLDEGFNAKPRHRRESVEKHLKDSRNCLMEACQWGWLEIVKYLVGEDHIHPDLPNGQGKTAVHVACENGHADIVLYFVELAFEGKVDLSIEDHQGHSAWEAVFLHRVVAACPALLEVQLRGLRVPNRVALAQHYVKFSDPFMEKASLEFVQVVRAADFARAGRLLSYREWDGRHDLHSGLELLAFHHAADTPGGTPPMPSFRKSEGVRYSVSHLQRGSTAGSAALLRPSVGGNSRMSPGSRHGSNRGSESTAGPGFAFNPDEIPILFISHRWEESGNPDPNNSEYNQIIKYLKFMEEKHNVVFEYIWIDYSCICSEDDKELYEKHMRNFATIFFLASHCLVLTQTKENKRGDWVSDLVDFADRGWCQAEVALACATGAHAYTCLRFNDDTTFERLHPGPDMYGEAVYEAVRDLALLNHMGAKDAEYLFEHWGHAQDPFYLLRETCAALRRVGPEVVQKAVRNEAGWPDFGGTGLLRVYHKLGAFRREGDRPVAFRAVLSVLGVLLGYHAEPAQQRLQQIYDKIQSSEDEKSCENPAFSAAINEMTTKIQRLEQELEQYREKSSKQIADLKQELKTALLDKGLEQKERFRLEEEHKKLKGDHDELFQQFLEANQQQTESKAWENKPALGAPTTMPPLYSPDHENGKLPWQGDESRPSPIVAAPPSALRGDGSGGSGGAGGASTAPGTGQVTTPKDSSGTVRRARGASTPGTGRGATRGDAGGDSARTGGGSLGSARREGRLGISRSMPASPRSAKKLSIESNNSRSRIRSQNAAMDKSNCSVLQRKGASNSSISRHSRKGGNPKSLSNAESSDFSAWATESRMDFSQESEYVTGLPILLRGMADKHEEINRRVNALGAKMGFLEKASHRTPRALPGEPSPSTKQQVNNSRTNNTKKRGNKHGLMPNKKNSPLAPMTPIVVKQPDSATAPDVEEAKIKGDEEGEEQAPLAATLRRQFDRMLDEQQFDPEEASRELLALAGALGDEEAERRASLAAAARRRSAAAAASSAAAAATGGGGGSMSVSGGASAGGVLLCVDGIDLSDGVLDERDVQSISSKLQLQPKGLQDISRASRLNDAALLPAISGSNTPTKRPPPQKPNPLDISDLTVS